VIFLAQSTCFSSGELPTNSLSLEPKDELISATINGLGTEYNSIIAAISTARCYNTFSFSDLRGLLLSHETLLKSQLSSQSTAFYAGKNTAYRVRQGNNPNPTYHGRSVINSNKPNDSVLGSYPASVAHPDPKPTCQICNKFGHGARLCYRRYDKDSDWKPFSKSKAYNVQATSNYDSSNWIIDSGVNNHVTNDLNNLSSFFAYNGPDKLQIGNGIGLSISHVGSTSLIISNITFQLNNVLNVPSFSTNLLSLSQLLYDNPSLSINFFSSFFSIKDLHIKTPLTIPSLHGLYCLKMISPSSSSKVSPQAFLGQKFSTNLWHAKFDHPSNSTIINIINNHSLPCIRDNNFICNDCMQVKAHILPFSISSSSTSSPLSLIHSDVWGPSPIVSYQGYKYYIIFVDDYSHFTWIYFMKHKSEISNIFSSFKSQVENLLNKFIQILRSDGGSEYLPITKMFPQIIHQKSYPYTPQQNGVAERKHRHIIELSLATMSHASIPIKYWDKIFSSIVYLINRLSSKSQIPYQILFNKTPNYHDFRVLGCLCFPLTRPYNKHKLELRAQPCIFIGYVISHKGYRCLQLSSNRIFISRNIQFNEHSYPFKEISTISKTAQFEDIILPPL
jgi:Integrase core domain/GAG-pre-integrase domain